MSPLVMGLLTFSLLSGVQGWMFGRDGCLICRKFLKSGSDSASSNAVLVNISNGEGEGEERKLKTSAKKIDGQSPCKRRLSWQNSNPTSWQMSNDKSRLLLWSTPPHSQGS